MRSKTKLPVALFICAACLLLAGAAILWMNRGDARRTGEGSGSEQTAPVGAREFTWGAAEAGEPQFSIGEIALGEVVEFRVVLPAGMLPGEVASSCSCLRVAVRGESQEEAPILKARYLALRAGPIEAGVAVSLADGTAKQFHLAGTVRPGTPDLTAKIEAMLKLTVPPPPRREAQGRLAAEEAVEKVRAREAVLVDIRHPERYAMLHAVDALHVHRPRLAPSPFFQGKPVFLIGPPLLDEELLGARAQLERRGVPEVHVVEGGVLAWQRAGGRVFQQRDEKLMLGAVEPPALYSALGGGAVRVLGFEIEDVLAFHHTFAEAEEAAALDSGIRTLLSEAGVAAVVLVDDAGAHYDKAAAGLREEWQGRVFYLEGGLRSYREHLEQTAAIVSLGAGQPRKASVVPAMDGVPVPGRGFPGKPCSRCP